MDKKNGKQRKNVPSIGMQPKQQHSQGYFCALLVQCTKGVQEPKRCMKLFLIIILSIVLAKIGVLAMHILVIDHRKFEVCRVRYDAVHNPEAVCFDIRSQYLCPVNVTLTGLHVSFSNNGENVVVLKKEEIILRKNRRLKFDGSLRIESVNGRSMFTSDSKLNMEVVIDALMHVRVFYVWFRKHVRFRYVLGNGPKQESIYGACLAGLRIEPESKIDLYLGGCELVLPRYMNIQMNEMSFGAVVFDCPCKLVVGRLCVTNGRLVEPVIISFSFSSCTDLWYFLINVYKLIVDGDLKESSGLLHILNVEDEQSLVCQQFFNDLLVPFHSIVAVVRRTKREWPKFGLRFYGEGRFYTVAVNVKECDPKNEIEYFHVLYNANIVPLNIEIEKDCGSEKSAATRSAAVEMKNGRAMKIDERCALNEPIRERKVKNSKGDNHAGVDSVPSAVSGHDSSYTNGKPIDTKVATGIDRLCKVKVIACTRDGALLANDGPIHAEASKKQNWCEKEVLDGMFGTSVFFKIIVEIKSWNNLLRYLMEKRSVLLKIRVGTENNKEFACRYDLRNWLLSGLENHVIECVPPMCMPLKMGALTLRHDVEMRKNMIVVHSTSVDGGVCLECSDNGSKILKSAEEGSVRCNCENELAWPFVPEHGKRLSFEQSFGMYEAKLSIKSAFFYDGRRIRARIDCWTKLGKNNLMVGGDTINDLLFSDVAINNERIDGSADQFGKMCMFSYRKALGHAELRIAGIEQMIRLVTCVDKSVLQADSAIRNIIRMRDRIYLKAVRNTGTCDVAAKICIDFNQSEVTYSQGNVYFYGQKISVAPDFSVLFAVDGDLSFALCGKCSCHGLLEPLISRLTWVEGSWQEARNMCDGKMDVDLSLDISGNIFDLDLGLRPAKSCAKKPQGTENAKQLNHSLPRGPIISWPDTEIRTFFVDKHGDERPIMLLSISSSYFCFNPFDTVRQKMFLPQNPHKPLRLMLKVFSGNGFRPKEDAMNLQCSFNGQTRTTKSVMMNCYFRKFLYTYPHEQFFLFQLIKFISINGSKAEEKRDPLLRLSHWRIHNGFYVAFVHGSVHNAIGMFLCFIGRLNSGAYPRIACVRLLVNNIKALDVKTNGITLFRVNLSIDHVFELPIRYDTRQIDCVFTVPVRYELHTSEMFRIDRGTVYTAHSSLVDFFRTLDLPIERGILICFDRKSRNWTIKVKLHPWIAVNGKNLPFVVVYESKLRVKLYVCTKAGQSTLVFSARRTDA